MIDECMRTTTRQDIGARGEAIAAEWMVQHGYEVLETNYFARVGEIDIVARHIQSDRLCFIEVKTRKKRTGDAEFAHSIAKQQKIRKAAQVYCQSHCIDVDAVPISFEHISVYTGESKYQIDHYMV
jgi:putative endonuclease